MSTLHEFPNAMDFRWNPRLNHYETQTGPARMVFGCPVSQSIVKTRAAQIFERYSHALRALLWCTQVHGTLIASVSAEPGKPIEGLHDVGKCDGIISDLSGTGLLIWTADCVPVLIAGAGVIGAAHAGWRGCSAAIAPGLVRRFEIEYGVPAENLSVALGPSIGACHYPVGDEVIKALGKTSRQEKPWLDGNRVDLRAYLHEQITDCGVPQSQIVTVGSCTSCDPRFASYRRDQSSDRQFSMIFTAGPSVDHKPQQDPAPANGGP